MMEVVHCLTEMLMTYVLLKCNEGDVNLYMVVLPVMLDCTVVAFDCT